MGMIRGLGEDLAVKTFGLREFAGLVQLAGLRKQRSHVGHGYSLGCWAAHHFCQAVWYICSTSWTKLLASQSGESIMRWRRPLRSSLSFGRSLAHCVAMETN